MPKLRATEHPVPVRALIVQHRGYSFTAPIHVDDVNAIYDPQWRQEHQLQSLT